MRTNSNQFNRKPSYKIYKSPRLQQNDINSSENSARKKYPKETRSFPSDDYNNNILKTEPNQKVIQQEKKILYTNTKITRKNIPVEQKKFLKNSNSLKNYRISQKKEEISINPLNGNKSNIKITSNNISNNNSNNTNSNNKQKLFYSNIDLNPRKDNKKNNNKNKQSIYIDRRQKNSELVNKYQYRPKSQSKPQQTKIESKYQNKTLPKSQNKNKLKQSQSQSHLKYNSNTSDIKIRRIPISNNYVRKTPQLSERKNIPNSNISKVTINSKNKSQYDRNTNEPHQHLVYVSNTSRYSFKVYQDKNDNNYKNINNKPNNYSYNQQQKNNISNTQNKSYKNDYKPNKINNDNNFKSNNKVYYSSTSNNQKQNDKNKNDYRYVVKDNKTQVNYKYNTNTQNNENKIHHIYESKNITKDNYNNNKNKYNYIIKYNNRTIDTNTIQKRDNIIEPRKNDNIKSEKHYKITYNVSTAQNTSNKTPLINRTGQSNNNSNYNYYDKYNLKK